MIGDSSPKGRAGTQSVIGMSRGRDAAEPRTVGDRPPSARSYNRNERGRLVATQTSNMQVTVDRLDKAEKDIRRLKAGGAGILLVVSSAFLMGQALPEGKTLEAEKLVLRDASGKVRVILTAAGKGPALVLMDANEKPRAALDLDVTTQGPGLRLYDPGGRPRVAEFVTEEGPGISISDENGNVRLGFHAAIGQSMLILADPNGRPRLSMIAEGTGPALTFQDSEKRIRMVLNVSEQGSLLMLRDADKKVRVALGSAADGPFLRLLDANQVSLFSKP